MKIILHQIETGDEEVIIHYREMNETVEDVVRAASGGEQKILGRDGDIKRMLPVREILYIESVDRGTFAYVSEGVYRIPHSLGELELAYAGKGFFRCAKSMILNIYRISELRSQSGGRIDAKMENGEHVIISRKYAKALRQELKGEE